MAFHRWAPEEKSEMIGLPPTADCGNLRHNGDGINRSDEIHSPKLTEIRYPAG